ncbi:MAG: hypothetical protein LBN33_00460, partial [Desulfovibrio sp.]|nr:hypothetical protein [Desulfovibrio sp.]
MPLIKILFCLLILIFVLLTFGSTLLFWYEAKNSPERRVPAPDWGPVEIGVQYLRTLAISFFAVVLLPLAPFVIFLLRRPGPRERTDLPALVMVHGLYHNASTWLYLAWVLRSRGWRIRFFTYGRSVSL